MATFGRRYRLCADSGFDPSSHLLLSSVSLSPQFQRSLSTVEAAATAAVAVAVPMVEAEASIVVEEVVEQGVEDRIAAAENHAAAPMEVRDLEEPTAAAVKPGLAAIPAHRELSPMLVRRTFIPQSPMASGIRSATPALPRDPVPVRPQASPLVTLEASMAPDTPLRDQELSPVSRAEPSAGTMALDGAVVGEAVGAVAGVGAAAGDGEVGALASDGPTGVGDRGRSDGVRGGDTVPMGMGGRGTATTTITGTTILRTNRICPTTTTHRPAI